MEAAVGGMPWRLRGDDFRKAASSGVLGNGRLGINALDGIGSRCYHVEWMKRQSGIR